MVRMLEENRQDMVEIIDHLAHHVTKGYLTFEEMVSTLKSMIQDAHQEVN